MVKVSVILPVYGVAEYIVKCTESLLAQTLDEMEFLFVDDHGPDNSIDLLRQTIAGHPREGQFRVLRPEHNLGAGMARNFAIPEAQGEYIAFVDSDDWVEPTMFEELYNEAKRQNNADLCYCQALKDYLDGKPSEVLKNPDIPAGPLTHESRAFFLTTYVSLFWTTIYRKELIMANDIRYPEDRSADDSYFVSCAWMTAQSTGHVDKPFYHYLIRPGSVCTTKDSDKYRKRLTVFDKLMDYARKHEVYNEFAEEIDFLYFKKGYISSVVNYVTNSLEPQKETLREIATRCTAQIPHYRSNRYYRSKLALRGIDMMIRRCPSLAVKLLRSYAKRTNMVC